MQTAEAQKTKASRKQFWWPNVERREGAEWAVKQAFWAAVVVAVITALFATLGALGVGFAQALGLDVWAYIDVALFGAIAFGLWRKSRVAAWAGLMLFCLEKFYFWTKHGLQGLPLAVVLIIAFVGGVRGTSALSRMASTQPAPSEEPVA